MVDENILYYEQQLEMMGLDVEGINEDDLPAIKVERDLSSRSSSFLHYEALCRGERPLSTHLQSQLTCSYKRNRPFLRLAPLKVEILHLKPKITSFKDVISESEIALIRETAIPKFTRAGVVKRSEDNTKFEASEKRTSKIAWLKDIEDPAVERISKRVEDMTDLTCTTAEYLQEDASAGELRAFDQWGAGNRIATVLFYLSQPTAGGATVFPDLNLTVYPSKNDAIFWYNLRVNSQGDMNLRHAACPVLSGVKWVANKWLHEYGQEFHRPCSLDVHEYE